MDVIDELIAHCEAWNLGRVMGNVCAGDAAQALRRLRAELEECRKDAETAERERCVTICKAIMLYHGGMAETATDNEERAFREGESCGAEDCIEAIENGLDPRIECVLRQI